MSRCPRTTPSRSRDIIAAEYLTTTECSPTDPEATIRHTRSWHPLVRADDGNTANIPDRADNGSSTADNIITTAQRPQRQRRLPARFWNEEATIFVGDVIVLISAMDSDEGILEFNFDDEKGEEMTASAFVSTKEVNDLELSRRLRAKGVIIDKEEPFQASRRKEIEGLMERGVFEVISWDKTMDGVRIFRSRFVDEIKGKGTYSPFGKSRLAEELHPVKYFS